MIVLPGVSPHVSTSYGFDKETEAVTLSNISWLDQPMRNVLPESIVDKTG
jgi:hypothetical protein